MGRLAFVDAGMVTNVVLGGASFAEATGAIPCPQNVAKGWSFDSETGEFAAPTVAPPPASDDNPAPPDRTFSLYGFRLLLTESEADDWLALIEQARAAITSGTATATQRQQLRAWNDFNLVPEVRLLDQTTQASIYALHIWGVLTQARADRVAVGLPPE